MTTINTLLAKLVSTTVLNDYTVEDLLTIKAAALQHAQDAAVASIDYVGELGYCGFAWVEVSVPRTNSREAKALEKLGFKKSWRPRRMDMWKPGAYNGQSMDVHEQGAMAYAEVLQKYGFRAHMGSRAD